MYNAQTQPRPIKPSFDDIAISLKTEDEYRKAHLWGVIWALIFWTCFILGLSLLFITIFKSLQLIVIVTPIIRPIPANVSDWLPHKTINDITYHNLQPAIEKDWFTTMLKCAITRPTCTAQLQTALVHYWPRLPDLHTQRHALQMFGGGAAVALIPYLLALSDVISWPRWEQKILKQQALELKRANRRKK